MQKIDLNMDYWLIGCDSLEDVVRTHKRASNQIQG